MSPDPGNRGPVRLLDGAAAALFSIHVVLRLTIRSGEGAWGVNLLVHILVPLTAGAWFAARALERRLDWRLTRLEIPLAGLAILSLLSVLSASFPLAAIDGAAGLCAMALLVPLAVHLFGAARRETLLALMQASIFAVALFAFLQFFQLGELPSSDQARHTVAASGDLAEELSGRIGAREPWSTLHYPNTFAGFLVLTLPFVFGSLLDVGDRSAIVLRVLTLALGAFGMWASGSLGAWVAAAGAAAAFGFLAILHHRPNWSRSLKIGAASAAGLAALLVLAGPLSPNALAKKSEAIAIRDVYWDAALRMTGSRPLGVGVGNFQEHFPEHKDDRQEETRHAHNDWLEVLAELGIPGLLCLLGIFAVAGYLATGPDAAPPPSGPDGSRLLMAAGIPVGVLAAFGLQGAFGDAGGSPKVAILIAGAWLGAFLLAARKPGAGPYTRMGLAAGVAGAAVHFLIDFDFYDPAFRGMFFLVLAALVLLSRPDEPRPTGLVPPAIAAVICFSAALYFQLALVPRLLAGEEHADRGHQAAGEGRRDEAAANWEAACAENPLDPEPFFRLGMLRFEEWKRLVAAGPADEGQQRSDMVIVLLESALSARPRSVGITATLASVHEAMGGAAADPHRAYHIGEAERHARRAVELYPTSARTRYLLGRILGATGRSEASDAEFREALRLSAKAVRVRRLALDGAQQAVALRITTGDDAVAGAALREWVRRSSGTPGFEDRWRGILDNLTPGERAIVDAALKTK